MNQYFIMVMAPILLITTVIILFRRFQRKAIINQWYNTLNLGHHYKIYQQLFNDVDGFSLSRQARARHDALEYTYGEIDFISFLALLSLTKPDTHTVFYDLGSGIGKAVLACAMVFNVRKSCGIELFSGLHHVAVNQQQQLQCLPDYHDNANALHFINADFLQADFSDATLIFINATAFFGETWTAISQRLEQICPAATVITTSKKLFSDAFAVEKITTVQMSWGPVRAYIHQPASSGHVENMSKYK